MMYMRTRKNLVIKMAQQYMQYAIRLDNTKTTIRH